jgi:ribosomal protein S18 acetylase RimI-like enzyme
VATVEIVRLRPAQLGEASDILARAFQDDPAWRWIIPDVRRRAALLPWLFRVGFDMAAAEVWTTEGAVRGAARWQPPGRPPTRLGPTLRALVAAPIRLGGATGRYLAYGRAVETLRMRVAPWPHWYLAGIGVDPAEQRRGIGSALLRPGLEASARDGLPAVLLTNSERNLSFYERGGFRVAGEGETPEGGPHAWAMVRNP